MSGEGDQGSEVDTRGSLVRNGPVTLCAAVIAGLSLAPNPRDTEMVGLLEIVGGELVAHAIAWAALAVCARWAGPVGRARSRASVLAWGLCVGYGVLMEALQYFVPGRGAQLFDLLADIVGASVGILAMDMWMNRSDGHGKA